MKILLKQIPIQDDRDDESIINSIIQTLHAKGLIDLDASAPHGTIKGINITFCSLTHDFQPQIICDIYTDGPGKAVAILNPENYQAIKMDLDSLNAYLIDKGLTVKLPKSYHVVLKNKTIFVHIDKI